MAAVGLEHPLRDDQEGWATLVHEPGRCATYGICGHRKDGDVLPCANNTAAQPLPGGEAARQKLNAVCPQLAADVGADGDFCCTEEQLDTLQRQARTGEGRVGGGGGRRCGRWGAGRGGRRAREDTLTLPPPRWPFPSADPDGLHLLGGLPRVQPQLQAVFLPAHVLAQPGHVCKRDG